MKVAIYSLKVNSQSIAVYHELFELMNEFQWEPVLEAKFKKQLISKIPIVKSLSSFSKASDLNKSIELMISVGGDGTFIDAVSFVRNSNIPIIGINTGRLGFLANIPKDQMKHFLGLINLKKYELQNRSLLKITTPNNILGDDNYALNEVSLQRRDTSSMITVHAELDGKYLNSYWSDGLIVATPTGSTAYSLSCSGPIVLPGCKVHILTPIAPHNLNVRPMVVPDDLTIRLTIEGRERKFLMSIDGQSYVINKGDEILITKADFTINVIKFEENNFLDTIRNKMMWGLDKRN